MQSFRAVFSPFGIFWISRVVLLVISLPTNTFSLTSSPSCWSSLHFELECGWTYCSASESETLLKTIPLQPRDSHTIGFASKSQAKRACRNGALWILESNSIISNEAPCLDWLQKVQHDLDSKQSIIINLSYSELMESPLIQAHPSTMLQPGDQVWMMVDRHWSAPSWSGYPVSVTKHWLPPPRAYKRLLADDEDHHHPSDWVLYEDDEIAVVHKPNDLTTIVSSSKSTTRRSGDNDIQQDHAEEDLQSLLPFLLQCPKEKKGSKQANNNNIYLPRPVHRLDKQTSGLVLVAKSAGAMKLLSKAFANRQVTKTYSAIVVAPGSSFLQDQDEAMNGRGAPNSTIIHSNNDTQWQTIDYPIDGKPAVSSWRVMQSTAFPPVRPHGDSSLANVDVEEEDLCCGCSLLLHVRPHTGRTHQIRRHLAYILKSPIVGDTKYSYVSGTKTTMEWHRNQKRMYLHCHELEFPYYWWDDEDHPHHYDKQSSSHHDATVTRIPFSSANEIMDPSTSSTTTASGSIQRMTMRISISLPTSFHDRLQ